MQKDRLQFTFFLPPLLHLCMPVVHLLLRRLLDSAQYPFQAQPTVQYDESISMDIWNPLRYKCIWYNQIYRLQSFGKKGVRLNGTLVWRRILLIFCRTNHNKHHGIQSAQSEQNTYLHCPMNKADVTRFYGLIIIVKSFLYRYRPLCVRN